MAEGIGLAASLVRAASVGVQMITGPYASAGSESRANPDVADLLNGVQLTADTLERAGKELERDDGACAMSPKAIQDAESLVRKCDVVFAEVQQVVDTRKKVASEENFDSASEATKDPKIGLLRKRLGNLKSSAGLLFRMLRPSTGQVGVETEETKHDGTRNRRLHQQSSDDGLPALELKLAQTLQADDELLEDDSTLSRVPTIDLMVHASNSDPRVSSSNQGSAAFKAAIAATSPTEDSETPESDETFTDDDVEYISIHQLSQCASHAQKLFKRINAIQQTFEDASISQNYPKHRLDHLYRRFCRRFESEMDGSRSTAHIKAAPLQNVAEPVRRADHDLPSNVADSPQTQHQLATLGSGPHEMPSVRSAVQPHMSHNEKGPHSPHIPSVYGEHGTPQFHEASARSEVSSREASKDGFPNPAVEDDSRAFQPGGIHRTKTGRISKAKKGLKVHSCECGKSYTRAEHLRRHQKNHTSDDVVCCDLCGKTFYRRDLLERHMGRHKERLTTHKGDVHFTAMPVSHRSGEQFSMSPDTPVTDSIHPFQSAAASGYRWGSTSSEASSPWLLPPRSVSNTNTAGQTLPRISESQRPPPLGPTHFAAQALPHAAGAPISPPPPNGQMHHAPGASPHLRIHTNILPTAGAKTESAVRSAQHGHVFNEPLLSDSIGQHSSPKLPHPFRRDAETDEVLSPRLPGAPEVRTLHTPTVSDAISPRKGFTPVNPVREEWFSPVHHQSPTLKERGRTGTYNSDQRLLASQTRSISPCANCRQLKHKCDADTPCGNCRKFSQSSGYLPDPTCRGRSYMERPQHDQAARQNVIESRPGIEGARRSETSSTVQPTMATTSSGQPKPSDEVLQRLVREAGSNKQLESSRADRKAFFDDHWARPPQDLPRELGRPQPSNRAEAQVSSELLHSAKQSDLKPIADSPDLQTATDVRAATEISVEPLAATLPEASGRQTTADSSEQRSAACERCAQLEIKCDRTPSSCSACEKAHTECSLEKFNQTVPAPSLETQVTPLESQQESRSAKSPTKDEEPSRSKSKPSTRRRRGPSGRLTTDTVVVTQPNKAEETPESKGEEDDSTPSPFKKDNKDSKRQHFHSSNATSPPPEPADKTSEEWISWKRARLSEGMRKRKRERGETASAEAETQQRKKSR